jgi:ribonuclease HI
MRRALYICSDGSVQGDFYAPSIRRQVGPACGGWCGWVTDDFSQKPIFSGHEFLGDRLGPQEAEYAALVNALQAARRRLSTRNHDALEITCYMDNAHVVQQVNGEIGVSDLTSWYELACGEIDLLRSTGLSVDVIEVDRKHHGVRRAHALARHAFQAQLPEKHWRPQAQFRPGRTATATRPEAQIRRNTELRW